MAPNVPSARENQLARHVLTKTLGVKAGENVVIETWSHMLPWGVALAREARRLKAFPVLVYEDEDSFWDSVDAKEDKTLGAAPKHEWAMLGKADVYIHMWGAGDRIRFGELPEKRAEKIFAFNPAWYKAGAKAGLRGSRLDIGRPFPNLAQVYGVDQSTWMDQVVEGTMVDPAEMDASARPIVKALEKGRKIRIHDENGTDLTLGLKQRKARVTTGRVTKEDRKTAFGILSLVPAGTVAVALDEGVADGTFVANRSSYWETGKASGGVFRFENGRLVSHSFASGADFFDKDYAKASKGKDQPGRLSIGLNPKLRDTPQLEDREAGVVMVGVGSNAFFPGGKNKSTFFSGIILNKGVTLEVDGKAVPLPG